MRSNGLRARLPMMAGRRARKHDQLIQRNHLEWPASGTFETCRPTLRMFANRGRPEVNEHGQYDANDPTRTCRSSA
jgi:hypothetical protein